VLRLKKDSDGGRGNWFLSCLRLFAFLLLSVVVLPVHDAQAGRVPAGTLIGTATDVTFGVQGVPGTLYQASNIPYIKIMPRRAPSTLEFLRVVDRADAHAPVSIGAVSFAPNPSDDTIFTDQDAQIIAQVEGEPISPARVFVAGEVVILRLRDPGLNHQPDVVETVLVAVETATGDRELFRLSAAGPDSDDFYGVALTVSESDSVSGDGQIAVGANTIIEARFEDVFDETDTSTTIAVSDPRIKVFDAFSGAAINGAKITIVDDDTGKAVDVYGVDGSSRLQGKIVSGTPTTDAAGRTYDVLDGEVRMPFLMPGRYRLIADAPSDYVFPSDTDDTRIAGLPDGPFRVGTGARGEVFEIISGGPPLFDIPLDVRGTFLLTQTLSASQAAHGDPVAMSLTLQNDDDRDAVDAVIDTVLPKGFRYIPGTLKVGGSGGADPSISSTGNRLRIEVGALSSGAQREVTLVTRVGASAPFGELETTARASAPTGFLSNRTNEEIEITDGLLSRKTTVLGRVVVGECGADIEGGVTGARIYLEDGRFATTDQNGRFHLDDLAPGPHVLRLDELSLRDKFTLLQCSADLRPGETARKRLVSLDGGLMRRITYRLRSNIEEVAGLPDQVEEEGARQNYTEAGLAKLPSKLQILFPAEGESVEDPSLYIGIAYPMGRKISLTVNGEEVDGLSADKTIANRKARVAMKTWRGIDLPDGPTQIVASISDRTGKVVGTVSRTVHYVTEAAEATYLPEESVLIADSKTEPKIAILITDDAGRPVNRGARIGVALSPPYRTAAAQARFEDDPLAASDSTLSSVTVGEDGIAYVALEPTSRSGEAELRLRLGERDVVIRPYLTPEPRPWILVAVGHGTVGYNTISRNLEQAGRATGDEIVDDGRLAFFAQGAIKGEWLLTLAYDSDKDWRDRSTLHGGRIDPEAFYPVYGDASQQGEAAPSGYPLYVKVERGQFSAMFGDFDTGLDRSRLSSYQRTLSGFKTVYQGDRFSVVAFAAEGDQSFRRDEILLDSGVGPYALGARKVLRNSETVSIVVRDRERLDTVLSETPLSPFVDYTIDYDLGEIELRRPRLSTDDLFNPAVLTVDYEVLADDVEGITAGGRAAVRVLDDKLEIGATVIHEAGTEVTDSDRQLIGVDLNAELGNDFEFTAEVAASRGQVEGEQHEGQAYSAELTYLNDGWRGRVYVEHVDPHFGLSQQSRASQSRRVGGIEGQVQVGGFSTLTAEESNARPLTLSAHVYRDENLADGSVRSQAEISALHDIQLDGYGRGKVGVGYRGTRDVLSSGDRQEAHRIVGRAEATVLDGKARVAVEREQSIFTDGDGVEPDSLLVSIDGRITERINASAALETFDGGSIESANLYGAVTAELWAGGKINVGAGMLRDGASGDPSRLAAAVGVAQRFKLSENWSGTASIDRVQALTNGGSPTSSTVFPGQQSAESATNASIGAGYSAERWSGSLRLDLRESKSEQSARLSAGVAGDITEALTASAAGNFRFARAEKDHAMSSNITLGAAYRPESGPLTALNKLEMSFRDGGNGELKFVNTGTIEYKFNERVTLAMAHGIRFLDVDVFDQDFSSTTQFGAADLFYRLSKRWDVGLHGSSRMIGWGDELIYGYSGSVGFSPVDGLNLRLGYSFSGFEDADFDGAGVRESGPFVSATFNLDEDDIGAFGAVILD